LLAYKPQIDPIPHQVNYRLFEGEHKTGSAPDHRKALNWVLSKQHVTAAISGMIDCSQLEFNVQATAATQWQKVSAAYSFPL